MPPLRVDGMDGGTLVDGEVGKQRHEAPVARWGRARKSAAQAMPSPPSSSSKSASPLSLRKLPRTRMRTTTVGPTERPLVQMVGLVEQDAVVAHERLGVGRGAMAVEIGGSRAHDAAMVGQPASDQGFVVHRTQAKGEVHALAGQIDPAIGESELQLDIGVARRELGHQWHDLAHAEAVAQADAQGAAGAQPARADELLGGIQLVEQLACTLVEQPAFGRWCHTARGPLQQPGAETIFQAGEELADRRGRQVQALRCAGQAAMLDDLDEYRHLAGPVGTQDL